MQIKSQPNYGMQQSEERLDEKLMQTATAFLLKISKAAETFIPSDTKH